MKLIKALSAVSLLSVLVACSTETQAPVTAEKSEAVKVYLCQNVSSHKGPQTISVAYTFEGDKAVSADVSIVRKALKETFQRTDSTEWAQFKSAHYLLNVDPSLSPKTLDTATVGQVFKGDEILAKNCEVH